MTPRTSLPFVLHLLAAGVLLLVLAAAAQAENLVVPGSGNPEYILGRLADAFNARQTEHHVGVPSSIGTGGALRAIASGKATLARVGRPLKGKERDLGYVYVPLGHDPVVFVAGAGVTVRGITSGQAVGAFTGALTNWKMLGGADAPIRPIGREITDSSRRSIAQHITAFKDLTFGANAKVVNLDPQLVTLLDRYPTSLGFLNRSATMACKTEVVRLALDGVEPTVENLKTGRYPLWLKFGLIHKPGELTPAGEAFLAFIRSPEGEAVLRGHGILPATTAP